MGLFDARRARRAKVAADRWAQQQALVAAQDLALWQRDHAGMEATLAAAQEVKQGRSLVEANIVSRHGEQVLWVGGCVLHEPRRGATTFVGGTQGLSIPLGVAGIRYRVGSIKGHSVAGPDIDTPIDSGVVTLTTTRLVFMGAKSTREWDFDKWIGATCDQAESVFLFHVSNRQKPSGLSFSTDGPTFNEYLALGLSIHENGIDAVLTDCQQTLDAHVQLPLNRCSSDSDSLPG